MSYKITTPHDVTKKYESFAYPGGERQVRLSDSQCDNVADAKQIVVTSYINNGEVMELALLTDAIHHLNRGRARMQLRLPYLPYARADRRFTDGDCFGLKTFGQMIDSMGYDLVVTMDAHSNVARSYIANLFSVNPEPLIEQAIKLVESDDLIALYPDQGAQRRYGKLSVPTLSCTKHRDPATGHLSRFSVPPKALLSTKNILIVDDICDGGGTFNGIAEALKDHGIKSNLFLYVTHGIFSGGFTKLAEHFTRIFTSDSTIRAQLAINCIVHRLPAENVIESQLKELLPHARKAV